MENFCYNVESWCELKYKSGCSSTGSITHLHHSVNPEVLEKLLQEAQRETSKCSSPQPQQILLVAGEDTYLIAHDQEHYIDSDKSSMYCLSSNESSTPILVEVSSSSQVSPIKTSLHSSLLVEELNKNFKSFECTHCSKHKNEIMLLLDKQAEQEKLIHKLKQEYEEKVLKKSPEFDLSSTHSSPMSSSSSTSIIEEDIRLDNVNTKLKSSLKRQNSSTATLVSPNNNYTSVDVKCPSNDIPYNNTTSFLPTSNDLIMSTGYSSGIFNYKSGNCESADWSKYWSSRPQNQPPK